MVLLQATFCLVLSCLSMSRAATDFYSLSAVDINGNAVPLERFRGKVSLVVNVASECGYTDSNYRKLVQLQRDLEPRGFTVLAFPCNQFHGQEPAANQEILEFAMESYSINFPLFSKINVKGDNAHEVYQFLAEKTGNIPLWNFNKYLIDRDGLVVQFFAHDREFADISRSLEHLLSRRYEL